MKRTLLSLLLVGSVALFGFAGWVLGTGEGAVWLIAQASRATGLKIETEKVEGRLADRLRVTSLLVDWGDGRLESRQVQFGWSPASLLHGELVVDLLEVEGLNLRVAGEDGPPAAAAGRPEPLEGLVPSSAWPLPDWLRGEVRQLVLEDFNYLSGGGVTAIANRIEASLKLDAGQLDLKTANYLSPYVNLRGQGHWDLHDMQLDYRAGVSLPPELVPVATLAGAGLPPEMSGRLQISGDWRAYRGRLALNGEGTSLAGEATGNLDGVWLRGLSGDWLQGKVREGELDLDWSGPFRMDWRVGVESLNPQGTALAKGGALSFSSRGSLQVPEEGPLLLAGEIRGLEGQLEGHSLQGEGALRWTGEELEFEGVRVTGDGLVVHADGRLDDRIDLTLEVADLGHWLPDAAGRVAASGWLALRDGHPVGEAQAEAEALSWRENRAAEIDLKAAYPGAGEPLNLDLHAGELLLAEMLFRDVQITLDGLPDRHRLAVDASSASGGLHLEASGGWDGNKWRGELEQLMTGLASGAELVLQRPTGLRLSRDRWAVAPLLLAGTGGESLRLAGHYNVAERGGDIAGLWHHLELGRFASLLPAFRLEGESSGRFSLEIVEGAAQELEVAVDALGAFSHDAWRESLEELHLDLNWDRQRLSLIGRLEGSEGGSAEIQAESRRPIGFGVPEEGRLKFAVNGVELTNFKPWLSSGLQMTGVLGLDGQGEWLGGGRFQLTAFLHSSKGKMEWKDLRGSLRSRLEELRIDLDWRDQQLALSWEAELGTGGALDGEARLPIGARLPLVVDRGAELSARVQGRVGEAGLLESLIPLPIEELSGRLAFDLQAGGSLKAPRFGGTLALQGAGAYLPQLGVNLRPVEARLQLEDEELRVEHLRLVSGESELRGGGFLRLVDGDINYRLTLEGDNFQAIDLPELNVRLTPRLLFEGQGGQLRISGEIGVPYLDLRGVRASPAVTHSQDVIVVGDHGETAVNTGWRPELQLQVKLGDEVRLKAAGLSARLEGGAGINLDDKGALRGKGEISVAEGAFSAYGVSLDVRHGRMTYRNDLLDNPSLDILALRDAGQVLAGVQIGGTAKRPRVDLYSRPAMPEKDILYAILTGRQATQKDEGGGMLTLGSGALMAPGESLFSRLRLTNLDIQGLFAGDGGLRLRHRFAERWEVESVLGVNSGIDLFYVIEFK